MVAFGTLSAVVLFSWAAVRNTAGLTNLSIDTASATPEDGLASRLRDTTNPKRMRKRLFTTVKEFLGMGPLWARRGDMVCVLYGCHIPVVLRPNGRGTVEFVGECYVDGFMNGEGLLLGREIREFVMA